MELTYATPALLFPAVSLLFISYTNRFVTYADLIRRLHDRQRQQGGSLVTRQIKNLRKRIYLIRNMQLAGGFSLVCCVASLAAIFFEAAIVAEILFAAALLFMLISLGLLIWEIQISIGALNIQLEDLSGEHPRPNK